MVILTNPASVTAEGDIKRIQSDILVNLGHKSNYRQQCSIHKLIGANDFVNTVVLFSLSDICLEKKT